jgi:heterodisulfide reductase subunit B
MKFAFFMGCTVPARSRNYEMSARKIARALGIELVDISEFSCCGFPVKSLHHDAFMLTAARNLALAEAQGLDVMTVCSACGAVLTEVAHELREHPEHRAEVNKALAAIAPGLAYNGKSKVKHFVRVLYEDIGLDAIKAKASRDLGMLKIAPHYGCHYLKPSKVFEGFDDAEHPRSLHRLIEAAGAVPVDYEKLLFCCGGGILASDEKSALAMARVKLESIKTAGADAITLMCPFCSVMYDDNQKAVEDLVGAAIGLPVLFYPQLLGLAFGMDPKELGLNMNRVKTKDLLSKLEPAPV